MKAKKYVAPVEPAKPPPTLSTLVREELRRSDDLIAPAVEALVAMLRGNRALLATVVEAAVRDAVEYRTQHAMRTDRARIIHQVKAAQQRGNVIALANGIAASILDMPLAGGVRLRDCSRELVQREATRFGRLADDCGHKARFLARIAQSVPEGKAVGDVVSDARALELWKASV